MKRDGCLIGIICLIVSPILFIFGFFASCSRQGLQGPLDSTFWFFTFFSITLFIIGIIFVVKASRENQSTIKGDSEIIDYRTINCAKCNTEVSESEKICPNCGAKFEEE